MTTKEEILAMRAGLQLDILVAKTLHLPHPENILKTRYYSTDISAAWRVEAKIAELGLTEEYGNRLDILVLDDKDTARQRIFDTAHASPEMRCKAALFAKLGIEL